MREVCRIKENPYHKSQLTDTLRIHIVLPSHRPDAYEHMIVLQLGVGFVLTLKLKQASM